MTKRHWPLSYLTIAAAALAIASNTSVAQTNPPGTGLQADQLTQQPGASAPSDGRPGLRQGQPGARAPHDGHSQHRSQVPHEHHGQHSGHAPHDNHDQHAGHASHGGHAHHGVVSSAKDAERFAALPTASNVSVENCWVRLLPAPTPSGGYFVVKNEGDEAIVLLAAATKAFDEVMLHQTTHSDGMSRMAMVDAIEIPAGETLEFAPGGYHAMFEQALEDIQVGDSIVMHFKFANNQKATAQCEIKPAGAR